MKIRAKVTTYKTQEIEVDFPLFIKYGDVFDSGGGYDTFVRYDKDGSEWKITENYDGHWEYEFTANSKAQMEMDLGYHLISERHQIIEPKEFYDKIDQWMALMKDVPR